MLKIQKLPGLKSYNYFNKQLIRRFFSRQLILGIETSCDDTGCAIVDEKGNILGEALHSQQQIHLDNGGIIPPIAQDLHRKNIEKVVWDALDNAALRIDDVNAIAVTVKPGLPMSLEIGTKYSKYLCRQHNKPLIPIHHMQAHALTARMIKKINFPFLVLLISGGHCLLALVKDVETFLLLGDCQNDAPGEAFDKTARRLKLKNIPEFSKMSGGQAIEVAASKCTDPGRFQLSVPLQHYKDCNFSLAGTKTQVLRAIQREEKQYGVPPDGIIPHAYDLSASFLLIVTRHLCQRVQRGMEYLNRKDMMGEKKTLVVSGGAACNNFIAKGLQIVCDEMGYDLVRPPKKLCTDNGVMIAWNGMEKWLINSGITTDYDSVFTEKRCDLGPRSLIDDLRNEAISCKWIKLTQLAQPEAFR
ncbi:tRNA N6-adenosine threonylcarbamoyltransferase, mitochondrial [Onthophagus taurus]|uniref:tRNA N6-adenosine threonylcarbamoyltransferase, mitochondrial n=1 Tax=Onthophagus taurus TaxID=166361 RepID=UPI0039BE1EE2